MHQRICWTRQQLSLPTHNRVPSIGQERGAHEKLLRPHHYLPLNWLGTWETLHGNLVWVLLITTHHPQTLTLLLGIHPALFCGPACHHHCHPFPDSSKQYKYACGMSMHSLCDTICEKSNCYCCAVYNRGRQFK